MMHLYVLLTRTRTLPSRMIHAATGDAFTHVALSLQRNLTDLYSFARKHPLFPFPAGLVRENIHMGVYARNKDSRCALYAIKVTAQQHDAVKAKIGSMMQAQEGYHYNAVGLLLCKMHIAHKRRHHLFCSQFVGLVLQEAGILQLPKAPSLMHPMDFTRMPGLVCCYEGPLALSDMGDGPAFPGRLCRARVPVYTGTRGDKVAATYLNR